MRSQNTWRARTTRFDEQMTRSTTCALVLASLLTAEAARAQAPTPTPAPEASVPSALGVPDEEPNDVVPVDLSRLVFDDARFSYVKGRAGFVRFDTHGELQVRYYNQSRLNLTPPVADVANNQLVQRNFLLTWLRVGGQLKVGEALRITLQLDVAPQWIIGDATQGVGA